jgi:hypothetical protein
MSAIWNRHPPQVNWSPTPGILPSRAIAKPGQFSHSRTALSFRATGPRPVDKDTVQDREQPNSQFVSGTKARAFLIRADERVMNQILDIDIVACERSRITTQAEQFAEHIELELAAFLSPSGLMDGIRT